MFCVQDSSVLHNAMSICIFGCGLYPLRTKSSNLKSSISLTSLTSSSVGKGRGVRFNWKCWKGRVGGGGGGGGGGMML